MIGLLKKDFSYLAAYAKIYLAITAIMIVWFIAGNFGEPGLIGAVIIMIAVLMGNNTTAFDSQDGGMLFLMTLPVSSKMYAAEKYLLCLLMGIAGSCISLIVGFLRYGEELLQGELLSFLLITVTYLACGMILVALTLPIRLKFGSENAQLITFAVVASVVVLAYAGLYLLKALNIYAPEVAQSTTSASDIAVVAGIWVSAIVINAVSYLISVHILNTREF